MRYTTLIDCETLAHHLQDDDWRIVDCRFELSNTASGEAAWRDGHLPGACYAHLDRDLSAHGQGAINGGRHPMPAPDLVVERLAALGISDSTQVVAYDAAGGPYASRLWWMLRWIGHSAVAVLDGGFPAWTRANLPIDREVPTIARGRLTRRTPLAQWVNADTVLGNIDTAGHHLVDARGADRFAGQNETLDPVAGHIPGAINLPFAGNLDSLGTFKSVDALAARFSGVTDKPVVHQCGSGVTACHNLLAMAHAGLNEGALYAGSWSEWVSDPSRPLWTPTP